MNAKVQKLEDLLARVQRNRVTMEQTMSHGNLTTVAASAEVSEQPDIIDLVNPTKISEIPKSAFEAKPESPETLPPEDVAVEAEETDFSEVSSTTLPPEEVATVTEETDFSKVPPETLPPEEVALEPGEDDFSKVSPVTVPPRGIEIASAQIQGEDITMEIQSERLEVSKPTPVQAVKEGTALQQKQPEQVEPVSLKHATFRGKIISSKPIIKTVQDTSSNEWTIKNVLSRALELGSK